MTQHVFISYAPPDKIVADAVCAGLESAGFDCWIEPRDVHGAESRDDALDHAAVVVVVFSRDANVSRQVRDDTAVAAALLAPIVPFRIDDSEPTGALRLRLNSADWIEAAPPPVEAHFAALAAQLAQHLPGAAAPRSSASMPIGYSLSGETEPSRPARRHRSVLIAASIAIAAIVLILGLSLAGALRPRPAQLAANPPSLEPPAPGLAAAGPPAPGHLASRSIPALPPAPEPMPPATGSTEPILPALSPPPEVPSASVRVLAGDTAAIAALAFAPDGRVLASGGDDRSVRLWDVARGRQLQSLPEAASGIAAMAFSRRGDLVAWATGRAAAEPGAAPVIWLWDATRHRVSPPLAADAAEREADSPRALSFSPDGRLLASGDDRGEIRLWDVAARRELRRWTAHAKGVMSVAFSPDGKLLASGGGDGAVKLWDNATGEMAHALIGHARWVRSVAFSPDGHLLASGSEDRTIRLWDVASGQSERILKGHARWVRSVAFAPDGRTLASGGQDNAVKLWNVATGRELRTLSGHSGPVLAVAFAPQGGILASASADQTIRLWNLTTIEEAGR